MKWLHIISLWLHPLLMGPSAKHSLEDHLVQWSHFTERKTGAQPEDITGKVPSRTGKARALDFGFSVFSCHYHLVTYFLRRRHSYLLPGLFRDFISHYSFTKRSQDLRSSGGSMSSCWLSWAESSAPAAKTNRLLITVLPPEQTLLFNVPALSTGRKEQIPPGPQLFQSKPLTYTDL